MQISGSRWRSKRENNVSLRAKYDSAIAFINRDGPNLPHFKSRTVEGAARPVWEGRGARTPIAVSLAEPSTSSAAWPNPSVERLAASSVP